MDSALTGDPRADFRNVYCSGGIASSQFDLAPPSSEVRVLNDSYRLAGATCDEDPIGSDQTHIVPGSRGRVFVISARARASYSKRSHLPYADAKILRGAAAECPRCAETGAQPSRGGQLVILGGHIALLDGKVASPLSDWITERAYPLGITRQVLRATQNNFESNLPSRQRLSRGSASNQSRAGGRSVPGPKAHGPSAHS